MTTFNLEFSYGQTFRLSANTIEEIIEEFQDLADELGDYTVTAKGRVWIVFTDGSYKEDEK